MTEWPETSAIRACIAWNETEKVRAMRDYKDEALKVPAHAHKLVRGEKVPLTTDEYRECRLKDASRYASNVVSLRERL